MRKEYTDPDDQKILDEWENQVAEAQRRARYYELDVTKDIATAIKKRIIAIRLKLSREEGMEREVNLSLHAAIKENEAVLKFFVEDSSQTIKQIEAEVDNELAKL